MQSREINDRNAWNSFVFRHGPRSGAFLHTWEWGQFQAALGRTVRRLAIEEGDGLATAAQMIETPMPFGQRYWYCPRGPVTRLPDRLVVHLQKLVKQSPATFVRFEPVVTPEAAHVVQTHDVQPRETLLLALEVPEEALRSAMHEKTRYNIGLSERKGVTVEIGSRSFDEAWPLFDATGTRGGFRLHPKAYYEKMLKALVGDQCQAHLAVARFEGRVIAANIMIDCNRVRTYLHGASSDRDRNVMAPFLLHWRLIQDAKAKGFVSYDWWGVAPEHASPDHTWTGITRFKLGFGGERVSYPGAFDLVLKPILYSGYRLVRGMLRK